MKAGLIGSKYIYMTTKPRITNKMRVYVTMECSPPASIVTMIGHLTAYGVDGVDWLVFVIIFQRGLSLKRMGLKMVMGSGQKEEYMEESKEAQDDEKKPCLLLQRCFAFMVSQSVFYIPQFRARSLVPC